MSEPTIQVPAPGAEEGGKLGAPQRLQAIPDLNLLPQRYRRTWPAPATVLAWVLMITLLGSLFYSLNTVQAASRRYQEQRSALRAAEQELEASSPFEERVDRLRADIDAAQNRAEALRVAQQNLAIQRIAWGPTLTESLAAAPSGLQVRSVSQSDDEVRLAGSTDEYHLPLLYAQTLRQLEPEAIVYVDSIHLRQQQVDEEATPTPTPTPTPAATEETEPAEAETVPPRYSFTITIEYPQLGPDAAGGEGGGGQ